MKKIVKIGLGVLMLAGLSGFLVKDNFIKASTERHAPVRAIDPVTIQKEQLWNKYLVDTGMSMLRSGDVVLRMGMGADSYLLSQMNRKDKSYSHCGIVMIENGYPFVYHSMGGEDNPDERMRRDSAKFFFSPQHNFGFAVVRYDLSVGKISELRQVVHEYYIQRPKFDMKFDLKTDDKLYCAEFIYKAVNKVMHDNAYIPVTTVLGYTFVGLDDLYRNTHANLIWKTKFK